MRQKIALCLLVFLILSIGILPSLLESNDSLQPPLQSLETHRNANLLVLAPNFRLILHDFFKLAASKISYLTVFLPQIRLFLFPISKQISGFFFCSFILLFFIFYQIARTSCKRDDPALMNGLVKTIH